MWRAWRVIGGLSLLTLLLAVSAWGFHRADAQTPVRQTTVVVPYTENEWWLIHWENNEIVCRLVVEHEGLPTGDEILRSCGTDLYNEWNATPPCQIGTGKNATASCQGVYLHLVASTPKQREVMIDLPPATVWVTLEGCTPVPPDNHCADLPTLVLTGQEPLPSEHITAIHGIYAGTLFDCETPVCKIPLQPTPVEGATVEFWADSSYGDSSEHFTAQVRVLDVGVSPAAGGGGWYVDVINSQWQGAPLASCARIWQAFPPVGGPPPWLATPEQTLLISSDAPYYYLAGRLISQNLVDASNCVTGGLLPNGYADACGLDAARPLVEAWQNQFDATIIKVARDTGVPAQLMKNLFAQESQFWPGVFRVPYEFGLGQVTENGADSILLWNSDFYTQFCPLVLSASACNRGYLHLLDSEKAILRGALALQAKTDCPSCPAGVDLSNTSFSVALFANMLQANCSQISQTIYTATKRPAGEVASYEDLWRFTIANYHAGPGCTSYALNSAWNSVSTLNWEQVSQRFTDPCKGVVPYVDKITH